MGDCLSFATFALGATFSSAEVEVEVEEVVEVVVEVEEVEVEEDPQGDDLVFVLALSSPPPEHFLFFLLAALAFSVAFSIFGAYSTQAAESPCSYLVTSTSPNLD